MKLTAKFEEFANSTRTEENLLQQFQKIAEYFLTEGYFLVNGERKIHLCDVEFYYHEESGEIKDYSMYHRNGRDNNNPNPPYFKVGQLNAHASGVDITFENEEQGYRAAMLVRGFKVEGIEAPKDKLYDGRSTYFYEALINHGTITSPHTIEWVEGEHIFKNKEIEQTPRINIVQYHQDGDNVGRKIENESNSNKFIPCDRKWRYHFINKK